MAHATAVQGGPELPSWDLELHALPANIEVMHTDDQALHAPPGYSSALDILLYSFYH